MTWVWGQTEGMKKIKQRERSHGGQIPVRDTRRFTRWLSTLSKLRSGFDSTNSIKGTRSGSREELIFVKGNELKWREHTSEEEGKKGGEVGHKRGIGVLLWFYSLATYPKARQNFRAKVKKSFGWVKYLEYPRTWDLSFVTRLQGEVNDQ